MKQSNTVQKLFELLTLLVGSVETQFVRESTNVNEQTLKVFPNAILDRTIYLSKYLSSITKRM